MTEIEALRQEVSALRRDVETLRRARWITPSAAAVAMVALVVSGVAAPRQDPTQTPPGHAPTQLAQDLTCKSLKVVNETGQTMAQIASDKDGGLFVINGSDAKKRFFVAVENNSGFTDWYDSAGMRRASMFTGDKGDFELRLNDSHEHIGLLLAQNETGGLMLLKGPDENNRLAAGIDNGGGYLDINDSEGKLRQSFYISDKNTAQHKILGSDGQNRFLLTDGPDGGQGIAYGADGKPRASFPPLK